MMAGSIDEKAYRMVEQRRDGRNGKNGRARNGIQEVGMLDVCEKERMDQYLGGMER